MSKYQDKFGMYHDKPAREGEPSSNNAWIYTAYAKKAGLPYDENLVSLTFNKCKKSSLEHSKGFYFIRTPYRASPPISRDEILGMAALGFLKENHLDGWNFSPYKVPRFSLIQTIKQLIELKGKHRNYFWRNGLSQIYRFAFSVPIQDRHFILTKWGKFNILYWIVDRLDRFRKPKNGIHWLKYGTNKKIMQEEFAEDHPLRKI